MRIMPLSDQSIDDLYHLLSELIDERIKRLINNQAVLPKSKLFEMLSHHFQWDNANASHGGKKLRSTICLLACLDICGDYRKALPMATAIEIMHNFSLIHDDIVDKDQLRRGRQSIWYKWNVPYAINLGDGLHTLSYLALFDKDSQPVKRNGALLELLSGSAIKLCYGQQLDMEFETMSKVSSKQYYEMITNKTASLFECASLAGAIVATHNESTYSRYSQFGYHLGMYFQIIDDLKGLIGSDKVTGKRGRSDLVLNKKTLPAILRQINPELQNEEIFAICTSKIKQHWRKAREALAPSTEDTSYLLNYLYKIHKMLMFKKELKIMFDEPITLPDRLPKSPAAAVKSLEY